MHILRYAQHCLQTVVEHGTMQNVSEYSVENSWDALGIEPGSGRLLESLNLGSSFSPRSGCLDGFSGRRGDSTLAKAFSGKYLV